MRQLFFLISGFIVVMAVGCGSNDKEAKTDTPAVSTPVNTNTTVAPVTSPGVSTTPAVSTTPTTTTATTPATTTVSTPAVTQPTKQAIITTPQPVTTSTAGLNPAHGQPGHRCDISVGAPLNSPAGKATTPTVNTNSAPVNLSPSIVNTTPQIVPTPSTQTVAAGMNPAHGQPGHRCDISVGAPLNSPVKTNTTPTVAK